MRFDRNECIVMNMKRYLCVPIGVALLLACPAYGQDIYRMEAFSGYDLNGTSRYVGMGGAMNALGADLSTMGGNPAAIGLFRKSDLSMSASVTSQSGARDFMDIDKVRGSFDQLGFVYSAKVGEKVKFVNFGFNYQKRKNFKNYIGVDNFQTGGLSQSLQMLDLANINGEWLDLRKDADRDYTTPLTCLGYDTQMLFLKEENGVITGYEPSLAESYNYQRVQWGGIQQYDINLSMNWENILYAGATFGIYNVDMHTGTYYGEALIGDQGGTYDYHMMNEEVVSGNGFDVKLGLIFRPIETSPFRIGFSVHTPTFYSLRSDSYLYMQSPYVSGTSDFTAADVNIVGNEYMIRTPWRINLSVATVVANVLALDAEYEFANYSKSEVGYDGYYSDDMSFEGWMSGEKDRYLNREAERFLKPVSTFKFGAEARLSSNMYARFGYNYVSAPMKADAYLNLFTNSPSYYYNTNTDYVNLGEINRFTCGLGYRLKHLYIDFAYQHQRQGGDVYAFHVPDGSSESNRLKAAKVDFKRNNCMLTLGYKF